VTDAENYFKSDLEVERRVQEFENCTLPDFEFDHPSHLAVALSYLHLSGLTVPEAVERMREALYRFLDYHGHGRQKYNETITLFWIKLVRSFLDRTRPARSIARLANEMIASFGDSKIIYDYYSKEHLLSESARRAWVEPDIKPLNF
jgi:hypothetical protein